MTDKDFKIGDCVIYTGVERNGFKLGDKCEIVADKDNPFTSFSEPNIPRKPSYGKDFIINLLPKTKEDESAILPIIHVTKSEMKPCEK